jgi:hypothetical protein
MVYFCAGTTGIEFSAVSQCAVDHCNFFTNMLSSSAGSKGLFYSRTAIGLTVSYCVFGYNDSPLFALALTSENRYGHVVLNCVFSGSITWDETFSSTFNNQVNVILPASHTLSCPFQCPTRSPRQSQSSARRSGSPFPTREFTSLQEIYRMSQIDSVL